MHVAGLTGTLAGLRAGRYGDAGDPQDVVTTSGGRVLLSSETYK